MRLQSFSRFSAGRKHRSGHATYCEARLLAHEVIVGAQEFFNVKEFRHEMRLNPQRLSSLCGCSCRVGQGHYFGWMICCSQSGAYALNCLRSIFPRLKRVVLLQNSDNCPTSFFVQNFLVVETFKECIHRFDSSKTK